MQSASLSDQRALVSGTSASGTSATLCAAIAQALAHQGAHVFVDPAVLRHEPQPRTTGPDAADRLFPAAARQLGGIDLFVHVAAPAPEPARLLELTLERYDEIVQEQVKTPFFLLQQAARQLREQGRIVLVVPAGHRAGNRAGAAAAGAAAALRTFARVLTREVGARGITVNVVSAGPPAQTMPHATQDERNPLPETADIVSLVQFLASEEGRWINGQTLVASAGTNA